MLEVSVISSGVDLFVYIYLFCFDLDIQIKSDLTSSGFSFFPLSDIDLINQVSKSLPNPSGSENAAGFKAP